jgi:hypothetical protein
MQTLKIHRPETSSQDDVPTTLAVLSNIHIVRGEGDSVGVALEPSVMP